MTQIPLLSGITASEKADFNLSYPVNLEPVAIDNGISKGYVRSAAGATVFATGPGIDRGGIVWNNTHYRVMGTKLVSVSATGTITVLGDVGGSGPVGLDYGFDRLAIRSETRLYYWDGTTLTQVTDPDLGQVIDFCWMDGYYVITDGVNIIVTQLSDPTQIDPLKYGSAESDPDMVVALLRLRNELKALGASTIETQNDAGGSGYPFASNPGATVPIGCVGPQAKCKFSETFAFVGAARNDAPSVWVEVPGSAQRISSRLIDDAIAAEVDQASIQLERRVYRGEERLFLHLSDRSYCYLRNASEKTGESVWYELRSGLGLDQPYRLRNAVLYQGQWIVGDTQSGNLGILVEDDARHFGDDVGWRFDTQLLYNSTNSFIVHSLELVGLPGRHQTLPEPNALLSYTLDGQTYSIERANATGKPNQRRKRVVWNIHKRARNYMGFRFRGDSSALQGWAALEAEVEALSA